MNCIDEAWYEQLRCENETCPSCGELMIRCEWPGCRGLAIFEAWVHRSPMNIRMLLCDAHVKESIGWKASHPTEWRDICTLESSSELALFEQLRSGLPDTK